MALTLEGKFAGEGLQSVDEDDDMLSAMARELVERKGIGETAESVLESSRRGASQTVSDACPHFGEAASSSDMPAILLDPQPAPASLVEDATDTAPIVVFGRRPQSLSGKKQRVRLDVPEQPSLFGFG